MAINVKQGQALLLPIVFLVVLDMLNSKGYLNQMGAVRQRQEESSELAVSFGQHQEEDVSLQLNNSTEESDPNNPLSRIAIMGQFNYDGLPPSSIDLWVRKHKSMGFGHVMVRGAFLNATRLADLREALPEVDLQVNATPSDSSPGSFYSPYLNLGDALLELSQQKQNIDGILYFHDDAVLNVQYLAEVFRRTKNQAIIGTNLGRGGLQKDGLDLSYQDPRTPPNGTQRKVDSWKQRMSMVAYRISREDHTHKKDLFHNWNGTQSFASGRQLNNVLDSWNMRNRHCLPGQYRFAQDPATRIYQETGQDYILFPPYTQADFLYVPLAYAQIYANMATLTFKHRIWLECAVGMIVDRLRHFHQALVAVVSLCTSWGPARGKPRMIDVCKKSKGLFGEYALYHPFKIGSNPDGWDAIFDQINPPPTL